MNKFYFLLLLVISSPLIKSQDYSFNQYNASLANISPAFIANIDVNQFSYAIRNQWPGYHLGFTGQQFSCSHKIEKINSGLGIIYNRNFSHRNFYQFQDMRLQYAYRVHFIKKFVLNAGFELAYHIKQIDTMNYTNKYDHNLQNFNDGIFFKKAEGIGSSAGIILQRNTNKFYFGINWSQLNTLKTAKNNFGSGSTFTLFGNKRIDFSGLSMFVFGQYVLINKTKFSTSYTQPSSQIIFMQTNFITQNLLALGIGYKYLINNYGQLNYRIGKTILISRTANLTFGYSFDAKPFIRDNQLKSLSSHEFYIKFKSK